MPIFYPTSVSLYRVIYTGFNNSVTADHLHGCEPTTRHSAKRTERFCRQTLEQFGGCVGRTSAEGVELVAGHELVAEAKVSDLDVHVAV